jgi:hypothetical protein
LDIVQSALGSRFGDTRFDARADLNGDDLVTFADVALVIANLRLGDFNGDGIVNLLDAKMIPGCLNGPGVVVEEACMEGDVDFDNDVDLADFAVFQRYFGR